MIRILFIATIFWCSINYSYGQKENPQEKIVNKNAIYGSIGSGGLYFSATGYYERIITQNDKRIFEIENCSIDVNLYKNQKNEQYFRHIL